MQSDYAQQYEKLWRSHWWWQSRKKFVLSHLQRLASPPKPWNILDIGCGNGLLFDDLLPFGDVHGIEPDPQLVPPTAPHRSRIQVRPFDNTFLPDRPLNLILMLDVLEHIRDDLAAAKHVFDLLAPGGIFLLTVPALMALWSQHDTANLHFRRYNRKSLHQTLSSAGFQLQTLQYFFAWTLPPLLLRRTLSPAPKKTTAPRPYQVSIPPAPLNTALYTLSRLEQLTLTRLNLLPLGSSLIAVARKPE